MVLFPVHGAPPGGGAGGVEVQEDGVKEGDADTIDVTEPDADIVTFAGGKATINLALLALLSGRAGGQTIIGGTGMGVFDWLTLISTSNAIKGGVRVPSDWFELANIAVPWMGVTAGTTQLYSRAGLLRARLNIAAVSVETVLGAATGLALALGQLGGIAPSSTIWTSGGFGLMADLTALTSAPVIGMDSNGRRLRSTTAAALGAQVGIYTTGTILERDCCPWGSYKVALPQTTNCRYFAGWTDQSLATMLAADDPAGNYIGLSYSTDRGDTNWQFIAKDGVAQTRKNTNIAITTAPRWFRIINPSNVHWIVQLLDASLAQVYANFYTSGQCPGATTALRFAAGIESRLAATAVACDFQHGWTVLDK